MWLNISQSRSCLYAAAYYYYWRFGSTDQHFFKKDKIHFFFQLRDFEHWAPRTEVPRSLKSWWNQPNRKFGWHDLVYFFFWHISSCVKKAETGIYLHNAWQVQFSIISSHTHFSEGKINNACSTYEETFSTVLNCAFSAFCCTNKLITTHHRY